MAERLLVSDIGYEMASYKDRHGLTYLALAERLGVSTSQSEEISRWIRGLDHRVGLRAALRYAERIRLDVVCHVNAPRQLPRLSAPSMVPALTDLSQQVAA